MTLFNITFRNMKKNFSDYFIYFVSMVFSIMIYYTFTSIEYNKQVADLAAESMKVSTAFKGASIIIAIFVAIFIWYSNSFFIKRRKKEVALYSMLGVKKKQIARMLCYENLVMGALALVAGILMGTLLSKLFVMILIRIMSFNVGVKFAISSKAIINTSIVFLVIFGIASLHAYTLIYRFKLIELFRSEKVGQKQPKASIIVALLSIILIGTGYYMTVTFKYDSYVKPIVILVITVVGTYMLFSSFIVIVVKYSKKNKVRYFKGLNMIGTSHLLYRIKNNGRSLATIAILSATTITAMGTAATFYYDQTTGVTRLSPFSYAYENKDSNVDKKVEEIIGKYPKNKIKSFNNSEFLLIDSKWPYEQKMADQQPAGKSFVISESTMKELLKAKGMKYNINFKSDEAIFFMIMYSEKIMDNPIGKNITLKIDNKDMAFKIKDFKDGLLINQLWVDDVAMQDTIVLKDEVFNKLYSKDKSIGISLINIENQLESKAVTSEIEKVLGKKDNVSIYYSNYKDTMAKFGIIIFLGSFMGLVFLICTGSIIFFKQLSEASEDKSRYDILRKIGVNKSEIKISIAKQMCFIFALPLIVGIAHSIAALTILKPFLRTSLLYPVLITVSVYTFIYLIYYMLTVNSYCKIVNSKA